MGVLRAISERLAPRDLKLRSLFNFKGRDFTASVLKPDRKDVRLLGFNPSIFDPKLKAYLIEKEEFSVFSGLCGQDSAVGFYPLSQKGDEEKVINGRLERLPAKSRVMVLPFVSGAAQNVDRRVLTHEMLHDIFLGNFKTFERDQFYKCAAVWMLKIQKPGFRKEEKDFFKEVSARSGVPYDLKVIRGFNVANSIKSKEFSPEFKRLAGECFAYSGELMLLGPDREYLGKVPKEMATYFRMKNILL